jgi:integrase
MMMDITEIYLDPIDMIEFIDYLCEKKQYKQSSAGSLSRKANTLFYSHTNIADLDELNKIIIEHCIKKRSNLVYHAIKNVIEFKFEELLRNDPVAYKGIRTLKDEILKGLIKSKTYSDRKKQSRSLSEAQVIEVINYIRYEKHKLIALLQSLTGARVGDIMHLKLEDIQPDNVDGEEVLKLNALSKGGKYNVHFLFDDIAQNLLLSYALKERKDTYQGYIFLDSHYTRGNSNMSIQEFIAYEKNYMGYWRDLKNALRHAGIDKKDFCSHDFRRGFAYEVWKRYKDVRILQMMLHHSQVSTSMRYLSGSGEDVKKYYRDLQTQ